MAQRIYAKRNGSPSLYFRFDDNGRIVEHWDVLQLVTDDSKNDNGLF